MSSLQSKYDFEDAVNWMREQFDQIDDKNYLINGAMKKFGLSKADAEIAYNNMADRKIDYTDSLRENKMNKKESLKEYIKSIIKEMQMMGGQFPNSICDKCEMPLNSCNCQLERDKNKNKLKEFRKNLKEGRQSNRSKKFKNELGTTLNKRCKECSMPEDECICETGALQARKADQLRKTGKYSAFKNTKNKEEDEDIKSMKDLVKNASKKNKDMQEVAPPGREKQVRKLKKKFPKGSNSPFRIAWSSYNKSKGKK